MGEDDKPFTEGELNDAALVALREELAARGQETRGDFGMPGLGVGRVRDFDTSVRGWAWEPQPKFQGWLRRSCCKAPDTMSHHYGDCPHFNEAEVHAASRRMIIENHGANSSIRLQAEAKTALARRILRKHLPYAIEHFLRRNAAYGDDNDFNLGSRGQYVDISRKVQKLKRLMWDGEQEMDGEESILTIVVELIGHLLMTLDYLEAENGAKEETEPDRS